MKATYEQLQQATQAAYGTYHPNSEWWRENATCCGRWLSVVDAAIRTLPEPEPEPSKEIEALKETLRNVVAERDNLHWQQETLLAKHRRDLERMAQELSDEEYKSYMDFDAWARASLNHVLQLRLLEILPQPTEAELIARELYLHSDYAVTLIEVQAVLDAQARLEKNK
jgi:hypothetical protein